MIKCDKCGALVQDGARFCTECGAALATPFAAGAGMGGNPFDANSFDANPFDAGSATDSNPFNAGSTMEGNAFDGIVNEEPTFENSGYSNPSQGGWNQGAPNYSGPNQGAPNYSGLNQGGNQHRGSDFYGGNSTGQVGQKNKIAAGLLAILLGSLGIHKFYLGYTSTGVTMLLVSLFGSIAFGLGPIVMGVISLVEGIIYLTKSDYDFYETYEVGEKKWF